MKIMIAEFLQETNTFSPVTCGLKMFKENRFIEGAEIYKDIEGRNIELNGFADELNENDVEIIPSIFATSISGGRVEMDVYDSVCAKIFSDIERARGLDGILLAMHGAMVLTEDEDATGRLLAQIREKAGEGVAIGVTLDFHANVTKKMVKNADIIIGYHSYPHIDLYETGRRTARLVIKTINKEINPVIAASKAPVILPAEACMTDKYPAKEVMKLLSETENQNKVLSASVFLMQPWLNVKDAGCASIVICDNDEKKAEDFAVVLSDKIWDMKEEFKVELVYLEKAFKIADSKKTKQPIIFADSADSPSAGSPGDSSAIIKHIVENDIDLKVILNVVDAQTALLAEKIGVGNIGAFMVGAKLDKKSNKPVKLAGEVLYSKESEFRFKGPMYTGKLFKMGLCSIIKTRNTCVVVMSNSVDNCDPELYRSLGFNLNDFDVVVVKSANGFRSPYKGLFEQAVIVDTPGASSANIKALPFDNLGQEAYPFSDVVGYKAEVYASNRNKKEVRKI